MAVLPRSGFQLGELAVDGVALSLLVGRDPSVDRPVQIPLALN
jgi:hypothetical protein